MMKKKYKGKTQQWLVNEAIKAMGEFTNDKINNRQRGPNLETVTLILDELRNRAKSTWRQQKEILQKLKESGHKEIEWLMPISYLLRGLKKKASGHFHVYLIRLDKRNRYGVYIGQTGTDKKTVEDRFKEHMDKDNFIGRPQPQKYGEEILRFPVAHLQNTSEEESKRLEEEIRELLLNSRFFPDASYIKGGKKKR